MYLFLSFVLVGLCDGSPTNSIDTIMEKVGKLEDLVRYQSMQISTQGRHIKSLESTISLQQKQISTQDRRIQSMRSAISLQQKQISTHSRHIDSLEVTVSLHQKQIQELTHHLGEAQENDQLSENRSSISEETNEVHSQMKNKTLLQFSEKRSRHQIISNGRIKHPSSRATVGMVGTHAFYAYMSAMEPSPSKHHTIIFDVIKTDLNSGYNKYSGTFFAKVSGTYVFTFNLRRSASGGGSIEVVQNAGVVGTFYGEYYDGFISGTVILGINQGDVVYLRTHTSASFSGDIRSDTNGRSTFCGWMI